MESDMIILKSQQIADEMTKSVKNFADELLTARERIESLETEIKQFCEIDVDDWEDYELKTLMRAQIQIFKQMLEDK